MLFDHMAGTVYLYIETISNGSLLRTWSLFLAPEQSVEGNIGHLADLESDSGNVSHGVTLTTKSRDKNLVVLLDEVEATVVGDEGGDLLVVLVGPHLVPPVLHVFSSSPDPCWLTHCFFSC